MDARPERPLHVLDVGMPRDVEPASADIDGVTLITLAELQARSAESWELREEAALEAQGIIEDGIRRFKERMTGLDSEPVIRTLGARTMLDALSRLIIDAYEKETPVVDSKAAEQIVLKVVLQLGEDAEYLEPLSLQNREQYKRHCDAVVAFYEFILREKTSTAGNALRYAFGSS